jgi:integrase
MPRQKGEKTQYPGVERLAPNVYRVRARVLDPRTGKYRERDRMFEGTAKEADARRADLERELAAELEQGGAQAPATGSLPRRPTVGDFATFWIASKHKLDPETRRRYLTALDLHALPHRFEDGTQLGSIYFDALRPADVQAWVNAELAAVDDQGARRFAPQTVHSWFRIFRTMARKAVVQLRLSHDPSMLIEFPELDAVHQGDNRLVAAELQPFLDELRIQAPQHYALTCTMAWTGLRFCHASALQWSDLDEAAKTIRVQRKNVRGRIGKVSRKKRAPDTLPLLPELGNVLRWHRARLMRISAGEKRVGDWVRRGLAEGWVFPARGRRRQGAELVGPVHSSGSLRKAWEKTLGALQAAGKLDSERFTVHGLRRTFNDLLRQGDVDPTTRDRLTAQTPEVRERYQTVDVEEMRGAMAKVMELARGELRADRGGRPGGRGTSGGGGVA